jgi:putative transposase
MDPLCEQVVKRIRKLPRSQLAAIGAFLKDLESGGSDATGKLWVPDGQASHGASTASADGRESPQAKDWPHAPLHRLTPDGTYIVTAGTLHKEHYFAAENRLDYLESTMLKFAREYGWRLEAWAVFSNHYHFIAHATANCTDLTMMIAHLHQETASWTNSEDDQIGRKVWFNYWDTRLTFERSYLARLNYVHQNAVKHGLVRVANQYRWCSAAWFERTARPAQIRTIYGFRTDKIKMRDDYQPVVEYGVRRSSPLSHAGSRRGNSGARGTAASPSFGTASQRGRVKPATPLR